MQYIYLISIISFLPFVLKGQDASTLEQLNAMGYEQIDLKELRKQQATPACSSCPQKQTKTIQRVPIPPEEELQNLKSLLPRQKQEVLDSKNNPSVSIVMREKYQKTLDRTLKRIKELEEITLSPPPSK